MRKQLLNMLMNVMFQVFSEERVKLIVDAMLDTVEDLVQNSNTKIDDMLVLPLCNTIRSALNVPDNDFPNGEGKEVESGTEKKKDEKVG